MKEAQARAHFAGSRGQEQARGRAIAQANASPRLRGGAPGVALKALTQRTLPLSIFHCISRKGVAATTECCRTAPISGFDLPVRFCSNRAVALVRAQNVRDKLFLDQQPARAVAE